MMGRTNEAEMQYKTALKLLPNHMIAHNNLGLIYLRQGKYDDAIGHLREAVRFQPDLASAHFYLAKALKQKGLDREAAAHHAIAGRLNSDYRRLPLTPEK
jgi:tetratricopeptide (TPR) repeat protein